MEFDEINALINIEREKFQRDIKRKTGGSRLFKQYRPKAAYAATASNAEQAAMEKVKQCAQQVLVAFNQLNLAMREHAAQLKAAAASSTF